MPVSETSTSSGPFAPMVLAIQTMAASPYQLCGPVPGKMHFLAVDAHSKWPVIFEMSQTTADKIIALLRHLFALYGVPDRIVSDNGPQFVTEDFAVFMKSNGAKHLQCSPYHSASNGAVEKFVKTFKQAMRASQQDGLTPQHQLENFLLTYLSTPHATTNVAPCDLFLGRRIRTQLDLVNRQKTQVALHTP